MKLYEKGAVSDSVTVAVTQKQKDGKFKSRSFTVKESTLEEVSKVIKEALETESE